MMASAEAKKTCPSDGQSVAITQIRILFGREISPEKKTPTEELALSGARDEVRLRIVMLLGLSRLDPCNPWSKT